MVLTSEEYQLAKDTSKTNDKVKSYFALRSNANSYVTQCLADRELQKRLKNSSHQSKAYNFNCHVVDSPSKFLNQGAINGPGWDCKTSKPCGVSRSSDHCANQAKDDAAAAAATKALIAKQSNEIKRITSLLTEKENIVKALEASNESWKEFADRTIEELQNENHQLWVRVRDNERTTLAWKKYFWLTFVALLSGTAYRHKFNLGNLFLQACGRAVGRH